MTEKITDEQIIALYWKRDEKAIGETAVKYGGYCFTIANNILENTEDSEECVSGTWWKAWNAIPPQRPNFLKLFLGKITRNLAINLYKSQRTEKRGGQELTLVLEELAECVSGSETPELELQRKELISGINDFLESLPAEKRGIFLRRYWDGEKVMDIATRYRLTENNVSVQLNRMRKQLKGALIERGIEL